MNIRSLILLTALIPVTLATGEIKEKSVHYDLDGTTFLSTLVWSGDAPASQPGILMVPNWMGPTEPSLDKAKKVAKMGYVVMMVDMYGVGVRPRNASEAGKAAGKLREDRELMRARLKKAHEVMSEQAQSVAGLSLDKEKTAAIGFCFGGGAVLEYARAGADLDAVVSFHGDLLSPTLEADATNTQSKVLVLHGAKDPYVPQDHVSEWVNVMNETDVDWQLVQFSRTVHSFTNPGAQSDGSRYNARSSARAFEMMQDLFVEIW